jgi:predicted CopG family antitoxin
MKTLTIRDKVYDELLKLKRKEESFSELLERLATEKKRSITEFAGFLTASDAEKMRKGIYESRKKELLADKLREKELEALW